ncbi:MAG TPA: hypothetical protein IAB73_04540 [Candidatus Onthenecus intestinigallinarum]|uniref:Uncharacterized protein n=1 Tax=Candidatus Onthenecus intestinigallinarum TaxID=2840875 RepID=A0A9D0ZA99_9FIRM|nr:hypothetical protein [Candidatus Onthenecus intestinigallinarum]
MRGHAAQLLAQLDGRIERLMARQVLDECSGDYGGFMEDDLHVESRQCGFDLSALACGYVTKDSAHYLSERVKAALTAALAYLRAHQRPGGCVDLLSCNVASAPDTAFMINAVLNAWWLLERCEDARAAWLRPALLRLIDSAASGIAAGGFHTPNHRWAIAACLLHCAKITGRRELAARAQAYLREGLDINEDGEFAERSAGNYNQVNDDQMLRLYMATGDRTFLHAAEKNLEMMYCYIDPDGSVFTNNSTRQDMGKKVYLDTYYPLYLMAGYFLGREDFGAMAEWIYQDCRRRGTWPDGVEWLLLLPQMDGFGAQTPFEPPFLRYDRLFEHSDIARVRRGGFSLTLMRGKPNFLYFQSGALPLYMAIYQNLCDQRNFVPETLERTERGFRLSGRAPVWYYQPFDQKPQTSDWWRMDNAARERLTAEGLHTLVEAELTEEGVRLHIRTQGVDRLPVRVEIGLLPGGRIRTQHFTQLMRAGEQVTILDGDIEITGPRGDALAIGPAFGSHDIRARMGGAYPLSDACYTVLLTGYTPVDRTIFIRARRIFS